MHRVSWEILRLISRTYLHSNMDLQGPAHCVDGNGCALGEGPVLAAELPCESAPPAGRYNVEHTGVRTEPAEWCDWNKMRESDRWLTTVVTTVYRITVHKLTSHQCQIEVSEERNCTTHNSIHLHRKINLNYAQTISSKHPVNTLCVGYDNHSVNGV